MLMSGHVIGHVIRLLIDSGRGLSNGCVRLLQVYTDTKLYNTHPYLNVFKKLSIFLKL